MKRAHGLCRMLLFLFPAPLKWVGGAWVISCWLIVVSCQKDSFGFLTVVWDVLRPFDYAQGTKAQDDRYLDGVLTVVWDVLRQAQDDRYLDGFLTDVWDA